MIEVSALLLTLLAEGAGLLAIILIVWIVLAIRKKGKDKAAATKLIGNIKKHADDRKESIKIFLSQSAGLEAEELQLGIKKIDRLEKDFFTQLVRSYLKRDGDILSNMDEHLDKVTDAYKEVVAGGGASNSEGDEDTSTKIDTLEKEKQILVDELKITKATMANMMGEFNTMFSGGNETVQTSKEALQSSVSQAEDQAEEEHNEDNEDNEDNDIAVESSDLSEANEETVDQEIGDDVVIEEATDKVIIAEDNDPEPTAPKSISESDDDFGSIVSTDDVDDILDGIDLSEEIDFK